MRVRCPVSQADMLHISTNCRTPEKMALTLLDYLFHREVQAMSNLSGQGKHGKKQLDPLMIYGIRCEYSWTHTIHHLILMRPAVARCTEQAPSMHHTYLKYKYLSHLVFKFSIKFSKIQNLDLSNNLYYSFISTIKWWLSWVDSHHTWNNTDLCETSPMFRLSYKAVVKWTRWDYSLHAHKGITTKCIYQCLRT